MYSSPKKTNSDYLEYLTNSVERSRLIAQMEQETKTAQLQRSLEKSRIQDYQIQAELASQFKAAEIQRSIERSRIQEEFLLNSAGRSRLAQLESEAQIARLERSLGRSRIQAKLDSAGKYARIQRSIDRNERYKSIEREEIRRTLEQQELVRNQILEEERLRLYGISPVRSRIIEEQRLFQQSRIIEESRLLQESRIIQEIQERDRLNQIHHNIEREQQLRDLDRQRIVQDIEVSKLRDLERSIQDIEEQQRIIQLSKSRLQSVYPNNYTSLYPNNYVSPLRYTGYKSIYPSIYQQIGNEEEQLVRALKAQVEINRNIEDTKNQLSLKPDFNLLDAFKNFDEKQQGYCSKLDFQTALSKIAICPSSDELNLYFKRLDKDQDGLLKYSEFTRAILPFSQEYQDLMNKREPADPNNLQGFSSFTEETQWLFKQLINKQISGEKEAELIRQLFSRRPFSLNDAFSAVDGDKNGFISMSEFQRIFNDYGLFVSGADLAALVDRYDKNQDGKVSYGEFLQEMTPQSQYKQY